ncbi:MAG: DNA gyrase/topoisomerase IV subunit A, partial [Saprospiraceae bacterium]|nr:DNA gyrase/topoisomerase IV subunit A [Saprospiraceae bacterium]
VTAITRDKEYDLTQGTKGSKLLYFTCQANGESEIVHIQLSQQSTAKKKFFDFDFATLAIKGRTSQGNVVTKYPVKKIAQISVGKSSLGAMQIYMDEVSGKLNQDERGKFLGAFDTGSKLLSIYKDGTYEVNELDLNKKYDVNNIVEIGNYTEDTVVTAVYFEGEKGWTMVKRFRIETSTADQKFLFIPEATGTKLYFAAMDAVPVVRYSFLVGKTKEEKEIQLAEFIDVKGWKALGNKLIDSKLTKIEQVKLTPAVEDEEGGTVLEAEETDSPTPATPPSEAAPEDHTNGYKPGDTIELKF